MSGLLTLILFGFHFPFASLVFFFSYFPFLSTYLIIIKYVAFYVAYPIISISPYQFVFFFFSLFIIHFNTNFSHHRFSTSSHTLLSPSLFVYMLDRKILSFPPLPFILSSPLLVLVLLFLLHNPFPTTFFLPMNSIYFVLKRS